MGQLEARGVCREYRTGERVVAALRGVSLTVRSGEFVSVMGPSGAGKSTLLHLLGGLDLPTSGAVLLDGLVLTELDDNALSAARRRHFGFIFQFFNLLPMLSAWENVALPALLDGSPLKRNRDKAVELLSRVNLADRQVHRPAELSGGEMQRVAIARALMMNPAVILADEPTGNLDTAAGEQILALLAELARDGDRLVVMVTHDLNAAGWSDRTVQLVDGQVAADRSPGSVSALVRKTT